MKKILIFLVAFFPLLAGATTSSFQFDHSSSDLNSIEVNSINLDDWASHTLEFRHNVKLDYLNIVKISDGVYQIKKHGDMRYAIEVCLAFLDQMREQLGCWKWYERDGIIEIDGYKEDPIMLERVGDGTYYPCMNVSTNDIQNTIESTSGFVKWIR